MICRRARITTNVAALSNLSLVLIILVTIVGVFGWWYSSNSNWTGGSIVKVIDLTSSSFYSNTSTLTFTLSNPDASTNITSVTITGGTNSAGSSCTGNFAIVKSGGVTTESCTVSSASFNKGETVTFAVDFSNGQSVTSSVTAQ
jgi:hypothetical protein